MIERLSDSDYFSIDYDYDYDYDSRSADYDREHTLLNTYDLSNTSQLEWKKIKTGLYFNSVGCCWKKKL
jgi:hypothetical protein